MSDIVENPVVENDDEDDDDEVDDSTKPDTLKTKKNGKRRKKIKCWHQMKN